MDKGLRGRQRKPRCNKEMLLKYDTSLGSV